MENNRADYAPKEDVIRGLAKHLKLNEEELIFLAGRIPQQEEDLLKQHYKDMPALFRRMRENPEFAQRVFREASTTRTSHGLEYFVKLPRHGHLTGWNAIQATCPQIRS